MPIFEDETIEQVTEIVRNQLQAHESDIEEEMKTNRKKLGKITFAVTVKPIGNGKAKARVVTTIAKESLSTETLLADWQMPLPLQVTPLRAAK